MSQRRYHDWGAPILAKDLSEPHALITGIGAQFGFDYITHTNITDGHTITIGSHNKQTPGTGRLHKDTYIVDKDGSEKRYMHGVITPDAILSVLEDAISLNVSTVGVSTHYPAALGSFTYREYVLVANRIYNESGNIVNFRAIANTTANSIYTAIGNNYASGVQGDSLYYDGKDMNSWYSHAAISGSDFDSTMEVIVGLMMICTTDANQDHILTPYNLVWPQGIIITQNQWSSLLQSLTQLSQGYFSGNKAITSNNVVDYEGRKFIINPGATTSNISTVIKANRVSFNAGISLQLGMVESPIMYDYSIAFRFTAKSILELVGLNNILDTASNNPLYLFKGGSDSVTLYNFLQSIKTYSIRAFGIYTQYNTDGEVLANETVPVQVTVTPGVLGGGENDRTLTISVGAITPYGENLTNSFNGSEIDKPVTLRIWGEFDF